MNKTYQPADHEQKIYQLWEKSDTFKPETNTKAKSYTVLMPPPNANAPLHTGHATYAIQDLMIRFKRMQGYSALYLPGTDHAGFETQVVYERHLKKKKQSRFDFDRQSLYDQVYNFVQENSGIAVEQLKRLGMSADWSRQFFTLDSEIIDTVYDTFIKMHQEGLVYRDGYMVNYSPRHGTTFSELETEYIEQTAPLYYIKYPLKANSKKPVLSEIEGLKAKNIVVATVRPETIYADVAIAVNPKDPKYKQYIGQTAINPLNNRELPIIADDYVDPEFGTGALKITPGHDFNDFQIGKKHNLETITSIDLKGKMNHHAPEVEGVFATKARIQVAEILKQKNAIDHIDEKYQNKLLVDYKDKQPIEPLVMPNWFINMEPLADLAIKAIKNNQVKFNKPSWKKEILRWITAKKPWPISRQTVFGIAIPAWYSIKDNPQLKVTFIDSQSQTQTGEISELLKKYQLKEIKSGLQNIYAPADAKYIIDKQPPGDDYLPETNTFDTWFSSGQLPYAALGYPDSQDFKTFFPTSFMDSMWDIIFFWIARMIMFSLYRTGQIPFKHVYFHGAITDKHGQKMSKSKGNVINPMEFVDKYGSDALRMGIIVGGNTAGRYTPLDEDKVRGYRNFANKLWNIGRFIEMSFENAAAHSPPLKGGARGGHHKNTNKNLQANSYKLTAQTTPRYSPDLPGLQPEDNQIIQKLETTITQATQYLDKFEYKLAGETLYDFAWHELADTYIEKIKRRLRPDDTKSYKLKAKSSQIAALSTLRHTYLNTLKLLHPFMPFVTETIWQELKHLRQNPDQRLITAPWPTT